MSASLGTIKSALPAVGRNSAAFSAARQAMEELAVAGCIGIGCVKQGYLTPSMVGALSKTTFSILLPMFLGTSIIDTVTTYGLHKSLLSGPLLGMAQPFVLYLLAKHILLPLFGIDYDTDDGRCVAVCAAWGNSGILPLIFSESLFRFPYEPADNLSKSHAQISLFLVGWSPFFWSYGRRVLLGVSSSDGKDGRTKRWKRCLQGLKGFLSPPVIGIMIGLFIAISPLKELFVSTSVQKAPMAAAYNTIKSFGRAASPLSLLVLTSSLAIGVGFGEEKGEPVGYSVSTKSDEVSFLRLWSCVSGARFLLSPLIMFGMLKALEKGGIIGSPNTNPILWFNMVLQGCMPSAQNLVLMLNVAGKETKAAQMAKFLFSIYATAMLPVVLISTVALETFGLA